MLKLLNVFLWFQRQKAIRDNIKNDEIKRNKSARFAIQSILYSIFSVVFCGIAMFFFKVELTPIFTLITRILAVCFALGTLMYFIMAIILLVYQFSLNKRWWAWLGFTFLFLSIIGDIVVVFIGM